MKLKRLILVIFLILPVLYSVQTPFYNFDMIGYLASYKSFFTDDKEVIHDYVYDKVEKSVFEAKFKGLTKFNEYRKQLYNDSEALYQQIPFYKVKILFLGFIGLFTALGIPIIVSLHLINGLAVAGISLILYLLVKDKNSIALFLSFVAGLLLGLMEVATLSTPDGLAQLSIILTAYLIWKKKRAVLFLFPLMPLIRPDLILAVILLSALYYWIERDKMIGVSALISILFYTGVQLLFGEYSYSKLFMFTFGNSWAYPGIRENTYSLYFHLKTLVRSLWDIKFNSRMLFVVFIMLFSSFGNFRKPNFKDTEYLLFLIFPVFYFLTHFTLFPLFDVRFYLAVFLLPVIYLIRNIDFISPADLTLLNASKR